MFFLSGPYVTKYSGDKTRTRKSISSTFWRLPTSTEIRVEEERAPTAESVRLTGCLRFIFFLISPHQWSSMAHARLRSNTSSSLHKSIFRAPLFRCPHTRTVTHREARRQTHTDTDIQIHRRTETQTHRQTDRQSETERQTDTETGRETDRWSE